MLLREIPPELVAPVEAGPQLPGVVRIPTVRQSCKSSMEPLVAIRGIPVLDSYSVLGILPARTQRLRLGALERLLQARSLLTPPFGLVVLDGWRSLGEQVSLLEHYAKGGPTDGFVASVDESGIRPPHMTGGAVDLTLSWNRVPLALGSDFDSFDGAARLHAFEHLPGIVRDLRRVLASCLLRSGFVPYELEWWHWSFGDDVWASASGKPALYDVIT